MQIADLAARPIAEKVLRPAETPERWSVLRSKLYDGCQGRPMSYGLKVYPSPDVEMGGNEEALIANGDAKAPHSPTS